MEREGKGLKLEMGNLGLYQTMTTVAKRVGGPLGLVAVIAGAGATLGVAVEHSGKAIMNVVKQKRKGRKKGHETETLYRVNTFCNAGGGLILRPDNTFRALERDGDAVLIEVLGGTNNPYFVSAELLSKVSDYE